MPVLKCPIAGCSYKTDDLDDAYVAALIEAHCVNHAPSKPTAATDSEESTIYIKLRMKKITLEHLRRNSEVRGYSIGLIFCIVSFLLDVVLSFSLPHWYHREENNSDYTLTSSVGLWKACIVKEFQDRHHRVESTCVSHNEEGFLKEYTIVGGAQGFQCLGIIFIVIAIVSTFLKQCFWKSRKVLTVLGATHAFWAGISFFGSLGSVSNGLKMTPHVTSRDFGYAFAGISGAVAVAGSWILIVTAYRKTPESKRTNKRGNVNNEDDVYQELNL